MEVMDKVLVRDRSSFKEGTWEGRGTEYSILVPRS